MHKLTLASWRLGGSDFLCRLFDFEHQDAIYFGTMPKQAVARHLAEMLEVADRAGIGGEHAQHSAGSQRFHCLARLEHGQRAFQPLGVEYNRLSQICCSWESRAARGVPPAPARPPTDRARSRCGCGFRLGANSALPPCGTL